MYKHVVGNLAKMKMNFLGLHTYPYKNRLGTGSNEPTVWVGLTEVQKKPPPGDGIHTHIPTPRGWHASSCATISGCVHHILLIWDGIHPHILFPGDGMHPHILILGHGIYPHKIILGDGIHTHTLLPGDGYTPAHT